MKKTISILTGCLVTLGAIAGDDVDMVRLTPDPQTNLTAVSAGAATNDTKLSGWVDTLIFDIGGGYSTATCRVTVTTLGSESTGAARTIMSATDIAADGSYPIRDLVTTQAGADIANTPAKIPLVNDRLVVNAYQAETNSVTLSVYIVLDKSN